MRILITADTVGGVWSYTRELASGLLAQDVSVVLVTLGRALNAEQSSWTERMAAQFRGSFFLAPTSFRLEWMEDAGHDVDASRRYVADVAHEYRADLLHANQFCFASLNLPIPIVLVAHSDIRSWWRSVHGVPPAETDWLRDYTRIVREGIHGAAVVVAPTQWMLDQIENIYGTSRHSQLIPNGCSPENFQANEAKRLQAVSLGRLWDEGKNIRLLEQIQPAIPILIAGDTRPPEGSTSAAFTASANSHLQLLGALTESETKALLSLTAIYIATSRYEPFGLAPVEAAFSGCAILANDIPSLREVWKSDALYYARNDPNSLAVCLQQLAGDPLLLHHMSQAAHRRAHTHFTASKMTSAYLNLYNLALQPNLSSAYA